MAVDLGVLISVADPCKIQGKARGKVKDLPVHHSIGLVNYPQPLHTKICLRVAPEGSLARTWLPDGITGRARCLGSCE